MSMVSHYGESRRRQVLRPAAQARGFTIVELLIATMVFGVILMVITAGILQFSRQYYKGMISTSTQNAARSVIDEVTRSIQYGGGKYWQLSDDGGSPPHPATGYCVGQTKRFSYSLDAQISGSVKHALIADTVSSCSDTTGALQASATGSISGLTGGHELLGSNMRVSRFDITSVGSGDLYKVTVRVVYGDDDLLCSPTKFAATAKGGCGTTAPAPDANFYSVQHPDTADLTCRPSIGNQFCAVSELSTTVQARIQ